VTAGAIAAASAMTAVLRDALKPNLVQTAEGGARHRALRSVRNIAHAETAILATRLAMEPRRLCDHRSGFGFDLAERKFLNIKWSNRRIWPARGGHRGHAACAQDDGGAPVKTRGSGCGAPQEGLAHLEKHLENAAVYGSRRSWHQRVFRTTPTRSSSWSAKRRRNSREGEKCEGFAAAAKAR